MTRRAPASPAARAGLAAIVVVVLAACQAVAPRASTPAASNGEASAAAPASAVPSTLGSAAPSAEATPAPTEPSAAPTAPAASTFRGIVYDEFAGGRNYIATIQPDGSGHHRLPNPATDIEPTLSPNGTLIAFTRSGSASKPGIYVMNADGSSVHLVAAIAGHPVQSPAWSPDGTKLAFIEELNPGAGFSSWELYTVNVDGSGLHKVLGTSAGDRPAWSPDGKKIAFENSNGGGIWAITLATKAIKQLTTGVDSDAAWSPDGTKIAFERQDDSNPDNVIQHLFEATSSGQLVVQVTTGSLDDEFVTWSPDGTELLFSRFNSSAKADLYLVQANGSVAALTKTSTVSELTPSWR